MLRLKDQQTLEKKTYLETNKKQTRYPMMFLDVKLVTERQRLRFSTL